MLINNIPSSIQQYEALLIEYVLYTLNVIDPNPAKLPEYNKAAKEIAEFEHSLAEVRTSLLIIVLIMCPPTSLTFEYYF